MTIFLLISWLALSLKGGTSCTTGTAPITHGPIHVSSRSLSPSHLPSLIKLSLQFLLYNHTSKTHEWGPQEQEHMNTGTQEGNWQASRDASLSWLVGYTQSLLLVLFFSPQFTEHHWRKKKAFRQETFNNFCCWSFFSHFYVFLKELA